MDNSLPSADQYVFSFEIPSLIPFSGSCSPTSPTFRFYDKICTVHFYPEASMGGHLIQRQHFWQVSVRLNPASQACNGVPPSSFGFVLQSGSAETDYYVSHDSLHLNILLKKDLKDVNNHDIVFPSVHFLPVVKHCELRMRLQKPEPVGKDQVQTCRKPIGEQLLILLRDNSYCDVVLCVQGQEIPAHRLLLAAYSPVFKNMFDSDMLESKSGRVNIEDLEPEGVKAMTEYMYSLREGNSTFESCPLAIEMYKCAHKYEVHGLKADCSLFLQKSINETNALDILQLSCIYSETLLKEMAMKFILKHPNSAKDSGKCQLVISTCPELFQFMIENWNTGIFFS